jgi:hypothetical protein
MSVDNNKPCTYTGKYKQRKEVIDMEELKGINVTERFDSLMARREKRNPGIKNIRFTKFDKLKATQWNMWLAASKSDLLS